jgi:hypothetical protein
VNVFHGAAVREEKMAGPAVHIIVDRGSGRRDDATDNRAESGRTAGPIDRRDLALPGWGIFLAQCRVPQREFSSHARPRYGRNPQLFPSDSLPRPITALLSDRTPRLPIPQFQSSNGL